MPTTDFSVLDQQKELLEQFNQVRSKTEEICSHLQKEDFVSQPIVDVSPPKWHLAHTTWFFETFILREFEDYQEFNQNYSYLFNSYYNGVGERVLRSDRGKMTRPAVDEILEYRRYVNEKIHSLISEGQLNKSAEELLQLGLQHEMQHQELLYYDIKYILGVNPIFPVYHTDCKIDKIDAAEYQSFISVNEGLYEIGFDGAGFCFDNERRRHRVFLEPFEISDRPIINKEFIEFIESGGYQNHQYWHSDAWTWLEQENISAPLYWQKQSGKWMRYTLSGLIEIEPQEILMHVSYYEACAYANWMGVRLPTEFEWEVAQEQFQWGDCWEWTNSAYLPYPNYEAPSGAVGEYNGKFMVNQMVLRGASKATNPDHSRKTYRNFFHPHLRWQFAGFRLARSV